MTNILGPSFIFLVMYTNILPETFARKCRLMIFVQQTVETI